MLRICNIWDSFFHNSLSELKHFAGIFTSLGISMPRRHLGSCLVTQETRLLFSFEEHSNIKKKFYSAIFRSVRTMGIFLFTGNSNSCEDSNNTNNSVNRTGVSRVDTFTFWTIPNNFTRRVKSCFPDRIFSYFYEQRKQEQAMRQLIFRDCPHSWLSPARTV